MNKEIPLVSVSVVTYNHEKYIEQCLDSILNQKTDFDFEIVLGEDDSTDSTRVICKQYAANYPDKIRLFLRSRKDVVYINGKPTGRFNFIENLKAARGKYIALCDGDDFWTDRLKLQKQVDFLESNQEFNYCGHKSSSLYNGILKQIPLDKKVLFFEDLIFQNSLNTATLLFRENSIDKLPDFFLKSPAGDWALQLIAIKGSSCYILDDDMSVYRIRNDSIWGSLTQEEKCMNGVKVQELSKNLYTDKKSIRLINRAIKQRKKASGILKLTLTERLINRLKNRIR
jgi:glycosyltransferase involved in cell wall biosynthesis